jgi:hypothetical protein
MFDRETVFVLGAGASWHYGYPTGEGLVEAIVTMARRFSQYCDNRLKSGQVTQHIPEYLTRRTDASKGVNGHIAGWTAVRDECLLFIDRLESVRPLLIDYFLAWNEDLRPIGKLMIAAVILECEARWLKLRANYNRRLIRLNDPMKPGGEEMKRLDISRYQDDWYRFIVHKLVFGCKESADLLNNKVRFITFNYDTSLEHHLYRALTAIDLLNHNDVEPFLSHDRIIHVYGKVHESIPAKRDAIDLVTAEGLGNEFAEPLIHATEFASVREPQNDRPA